jgi:hypothetical protein
MPADFILTVAPLLVFLSIGGFVLRIVWIAVAVRAFIRQYQAAIAQQQQLLTLLAQGGTNDPNLQDAMVQAAQKSAIALTRMNPAEQAQRASELLHTLTQLGQLQNGGSWRNGARFDGGNIYMPGGPSVVNGQLVVPGYTYKW